MPHSHAFQTACPSCDRLLDIPALNPGTAAACGRCGTRITSAGHNTAQLAAALSISAIVLLSLSVSFDFLTLEQLGLANQISLPQTIVALYNDNAQALAVFVGFLILVAPLILLIGQLSLLYLLYGRNHLGHKPGEQHTQPQLSQQMVRLGRRAPEITLAAALCRLRRTLMQWSMVEVFLIGTLVSLVKLMGMARVELGVGFWSFCGFVLCFVAAFALLDEHQLWQAVARQSQDDADL